MTWEKEKAYKAKRGAALITDMEQALINKDRRAFETAYIISMRYTTKKEREMLYRRFLKSLLKTA